MQPLLTHVPPSSLRSMSAVFSPSLSSRAQSAGAAWPTPITIASKRSATAFPENEQAVIRGHGVVFFYHQSVFRGQRRDRFLVTQAALRVAPSQPRIEGLIARRGVLAAVIERAVHGEHAAVRQQAADAAHHALDLRPGNDVQRIGSEDGVNRQFWKWMINIELDRLEQPRRLRL